VNLGREEGRSWNDRRKYGFFSAGGNEKYSRPLRRLTIGDKLFAYAKGYGYVGYGVVTQEKTLAAEFVPEDETRPLSQLQLETPIPSDPPIDGREEYAVGVRWIEAVARDEAKWFSGAFANQNIVCKLREPTTLEFLQKEFNANLVDDEM